LLRKSILDESQQASATGWPHRNIQVACQMLPKEILRCFSMLNDKRAELAASPEANFEQAAQNLAGRRQLPTMAAGR
jgi:hypothetical protein